MSLIALMIAAALAGAPLTLVAVMALVAVSPPAALVAGAGSLLVAAYRRTSGKTHEAVSEAVFCSAIAAELNAGASLRHALATAADGQPGTELATAARAAIAGASSFEVAAHLEGALPDNGRHARLAYELASETGAGAAETFNRLSERATQAADLRRERVSLTAQARLSAFVVGGAPVAIVLLLFLSGRFHLFADAGTAGMAVLGAGLGLMGAGLLTVWLLLRGPAA